MENKLQRIALSDLQLGMYVVSVVNPKKDVKVKSEGYILKQATVDKLIKSGIKEVEIDPSKAKVNEAAEKPEQEQKPKASEPDIYQDSHSFGSEIHKARALFDDAKSLQMKLIHDIGQDKQLNIEEVNQTTNAIVDSVFRNRDALSCLSRLRIKDEYLIEHSLNVAILMSIFAKHLRLGKEIIEQLALGAFLHDLGKIKVPDHILHKPGKFTDAEYEEMKRHVNYGVEIVRQQPGIPPLALEIVRHHHERLDGRGYPNQLGAEDLDKYARMIAIVDSYDAMTADRVYKQGMYPIQAFKILRAEANNGYDQELVEQFIQCLGVYPVGTLVKLTSGKLGLISKLNKSKPLNPIVKVFYNTRLNQTIAIEELDLSVAKYQDQIECCIKPEEFDLNLLGFFKLAFFQG